MRAVIIFTLLFYSLIGFFINELPSTPGSENSTLISEKQINEEVRVVASEAPGIADAVVVAGNNLFAVVKTIYLLLSFQLNGVPFLINLLFLIPANITVYMVAVQLARGS